MGGDEVDEGNMSQGIERQREKEEKEAEPSYSG